MQEPPISEEEFKIPLSDISGAIKRNRWGILACSIGSGLLFGFCCLLKPVRYIAEGSFKEQSNTLTASNDSFLSSVLLSTMSSSDQSEARTMMQSKKLLGEVAKILNLQASLRDTSRKSGIINKIKSNGIIEYHYFMNIQDYPLKDENPIIAVTNINYSSDFSSNLDITFDLGDKYLVSKDAETVGTGKIGIPFQTKEYSFTLSRCCEDSLFEKNYKLSLTP